jgi:hypothetical protein
MVKMKRGQLILLGILALLSLTLVSAVDFTIGDEVGDVWSGIPSEERSSLDIVNAEIISHTNSFDVTLTMNGNIQSPPTSVNWYGFSLHINSFERAYRIGTAL